MYGKINKESAKKKKKKKKKRKKEKENLWSRSVCPVPFYRKFSLVFHFKWKAPQALVVLRDMESTIHRLINCFLLVLIR